MIFFENRTCERCGHRLGYIPQLDTLSALECDEDASWRALAASEAGWRFCDNAGSDVCNWLIHADSTERLCVACRHNRTVPDLSVPDNLQKWRKMMLAAHRLFYTISRLRLPMPTRLDDPVRGLAFDFLADPSAPDGGKV